MEFMDPEEPGKGLVLACERRQDQGERDPRDKDNLNFTRYGCGVNLGLAEGKR